MKTETKAEKTRYILEQGKRLSQSMLWELQRRYFTEEGPKAWGAGAVPYYITSNPFIARAYAHVVLAFLKESLEAGADKEEPFYLLELGTGSGRFSFFFLKELSSLIKRIRPTPPKFCYVMTDFVEKNIEFWQNHEALQPFVKAGQLDFALFDATCDKEVKLRNQKITLGQTPLVNPLIVIANYFFDGLPQDAFFLAQGDLLEGLVTLTTSQQEADPLDPSLLSRVSLRYEKKPIRAEGYYQNPKLDGLLTFYQKKFSQLALRFPIVAFRCIEVLRQLSGGRMLMLTSDKGYTSEEILTGLRAPRIAVHGSFSMGVNYHAIGQYFRSLGGQMMHGEQPHEHLAVVGFLLGEAKGGFLETREAFEDQIIRFGPDEFFSLKKALESGSLQLAQLFALFRLSGDDSWLLTHYQSQLIEKVKDAPDADKKDLIGFLERAWQSYYHIAEGSDFPFCAGMILYEMSMYPEALVYFERSLEIYGKDPNTYYNIALCHYQEQRKKEAFGFVKKALEQNAEHKPSKELFNELKEAGYK